MALRSVVNVRSIDELYSDYNVGFFASGFERRCTAFLERIDRRIIKELFVVGFSEGKGETSRAASDSFYSSKHPTKVVESSAGEFKFVKMLLTQALNDTNGEVKILVDYSSMSRRWYGSILRFVASTLKNKRVTIDFCYVPGGHADEKLPAEMKSVTAVAGFEGSSQGTGTTTAVFSLGFEKWTPYAARERIQPNETMCILAEPGAIEKYAGRAYETNKEFFLECGCQPISFDLRNVQGTFTYLCEVVSLKLHNGFDVALVGIGPKPHILSMLLTAVRFPEATVVHVKRATKIAEQVEALPFQIITRVVFEPDRRSEI